ncbi:MAG: MBL fold metallo-hydrolase [Cellulosilyticum sp.]|nr:MBL fold metallo-hydrolase [Cellulosilyticum sp.]
MIEIARGMLCEELTYFYIDEKTKHGFVIDPGADGNRLADYAKEKGYVIEKILLTHGHGDHMYGAEALRAATGAPIVMHKEGHNYVTNPDWNLAYMLCGEKISFEADCYLEHGDEIALEANPDFKVRMIHVPGHTTDGVAYYSEKEGLAFVGDIIFAGAVGRSDFPGGNSVRLLSAIRAQIFTLPAETVLLPGHGPQTTVGHEKDTNPVFNMFDE